MHCVIIFGLKFFLFITYSGYLLRYMISSKNDCLQNITHLLIDEVHERDVTTDFLLIAVKAALQKYPHLKLVIMSATMNSKKFSEYFNNCPVIDVDGRMFKIETIHLDELLIRTDYRTEAMDKYMASQTSNEAISSLEAYQRTKQSNEIDHTLLLHTITHIHTKTSMDGSILVFLPGIDDITKQKKMILEESSLQNYELFVLHSGVNGTCSTEQERVLNRMERGIRKIILSTNVAETSLTIDDVVCICHTALY